jgi:hypothetical protein
VDALVRLRRAAVTLLQQAWCKNWEGFLLIPLHPSSCAPGRPGWSSGTLQHLPQLLSERLRQFGTAMKRGGGVLEERDAPLLVEPYGDQRLQGVCGWVQV